MADKQQEKGTHFWVAVGFIAVGFLFLLDNFGILGFGDVWALWPAIFIVVGIFKLREAKSQQDKNSAYIFIGVGTLLTLLMTDILDWGDIWVLWPVILIVVGLSMIY
ncbi:DUF5668 domain-containing protein, partial [bacterium]|nr:DUF5668 domain-containing protein [bacterium]